MNDNEKEELAFQQQLEQVGAALANASIIVASYFLQLEKAGVPRRVAAMLTSDMQAGLLNMMFGMKG